MSHESSAAFYKGVKFWLTLILAASLAALIWRAWSQLGDGSVEPGSAGARIGGSDDQRVSYIR